MRMMPFWCCYRPAFMASPYCVDACLVIVCVYAGIDYLIQTRHGPLYLCEIKFSRNPISTPIEAEVRDKSKRLSAPRHCSILPVLVHANEVSESVRYGGTFTRIVDFAEILAADKRVEPWGAIGEDKLTGNKGRTVR